MSYDIIRRLYGQTNHGFNVTLECLQLRSIADYLTGQSDFPYEDIASFGTNLWFNYTGSKTWSLTNGYKIKLENQGTSPFNIKLLDPDNTVISAMGLSYEADPDKAEVTAMNFGLIFDPSATDPANCSRLIGYSEWLVKTGEHAGEYEYRTQLLNPNTLLMKNFLQPDEEGDVPYSDNPDPYLEPDSSGGGGNGSHDNESDDITEPGTPSISVTDSGFVDLYTPSVGQMRSLYNYLWSNSFDLDNFKKMFSDPMEAILGFSALPFTISAGASHTVKLGNVDTGISMPIVASQYKTIDCGSINIPEYWGSYLDFNPYTEIEIYLPYIGSRSLDTDEVMGRSVNVTYKIDVVSGGCVALIKIDGSVRYTYSGACAVQMPINRYNFDAVISGAIQIGASIVGGIATGGIGAGVAVASVANAVMKTKTHVEKTGSMGGSAGIMGVQKPYITIKRPNPCIPYGQNEVQGYPSFIYETLGSLSGFTKVSDIFLDNINATDAEKDEILTLLKGGVIL